jgi:uncharacterized tellurite resistance protein B-like protein
VLHDAGMFGRWLSALTTEPDEAPSELLGTIRKHLPGADEETVRVVAALAGLLAAVAYADREYSDTEEAEVRASLGRVHGMTSTGADAVCDALKRTLVSHVAVEVPRCTRTLRELGDVELRREVLDALVDLAAADGRITTPETNLLRQVTTALGLSQSDYNASQERHRERLSVLKS